MRVAILHDLVREDSPVDARDVLDEVRDVSAALDALGHEHVAVACTLDLAGLGRTLGDIRPDVAWNLVESLEGHGRLIHLVPALLDVLGIPYTGASSEAVYVTSGKLLTKERLCDWGLPTPPWVSHPPRPGDRLPGPGPGTFVVKSAWEHASIGLTDGSIVRAEGVDELRAILAGRAAALGGECLAEAFIEGREMNLSVLASEPGPEVLPISEILFDQYPEGKPHIVGYEAKWEKGSFEYDHTPRRLEMPAEDAPLALSLRQLALRSWERFGLAGYARVDFRVDGDGRPWILELNANPCISRGAGFHASVLAAGIPYEKVIARILAEARGG